MWCWYKEKQQRDGVALNKGSSFGGTVWSRSEKTSEEEQVERILEAALLAVHAGEAVLARVSANHPGVAMEVLKYR